jgi:hypothetical protein
VDIWTPQCSCVGISIPLAKLVKYENPFFPIHNIDRYIQVNLEADNMPIRPICRANHDPSMLCIDRTGEVLRDIGAERQPKMSEKEFKEAAHKTDKTMLIVLLIFAGLVCLSILLSMFFSK